MGCGLPAQQVVEKSVTIPGTVGDARQACMEVARDMGLAPSSQSPPSLVLRERPRAFSTSPDIAVHITQQEGEVRIYVVGSTWPGWSTWERRYVARVVDAFTQRVQRQMGFPSTPSQPGRAKRWRRVGIGLLKMVEWIPLPMFGAAIVIPIAVWGAGRSVFWWSWPAFVCVSFALQRSALLARRRLIGTACRTDYAAAGLAIVVLLLAMVTGLVLLHGRL
jgi:hypothetical protein